MMEALILKLISSPGTEHLCSTESMCRPSSTQVDLGIDLKVKGSTHVDLFVGQGHRSLSEGFLFQLHPCKIGASPLKISAVTKVKPSASEIRTRIYNLGGLQSLHDSWALKMHPLPPPVQAEWNVSLL